MTERRARLRDLYAPIPVGAHLDDATWEALALDELSPTARAEAVAHVETCRTCAAMFRGVVAIGEPAAPAATAIDELAARRRRARWAGLAAVVAIAAAILLVVRLRETAAPRGDDVLRGSGGAVVEQLAPRGDVRAPAFAWRPVDGADAYVVRVFTDDGQPLWTSSPVAAPPLSWPAGSPAAPGRYHWYVEATGGGAVIARGRIADFAIVP